MVKQDSVNWKIVFLTVKNVNLRWMHAILEISAT